MHALQQPHCVNFGSLGNDSANERIGGRALGHLRDSIVVSISACHAEDPGSIPGRGISGPCAVSCEPPGL
jgi:hypothetical protein